MLAPSRLRALAVAVALTLALLAATATPATAGTVATKDLPTGNLTSQVRWTSPGGINNPIHYIVQLGLWIPLSMDNGLRMDVKIGNYAGYAFAQMRYVSGTGNFGGISNVFLVNGQSFPASTPNWFDNGSKKVCTTGSDTLYGCAQIGDGSLWDQPIYDAPPNSGTSVIGVHAVTCYQIGFEVQQCEHWWLTAF